MVDTRKLLFAYPAQVGVNESVDEFWATCEIVPE